MTQEEYLALRASALTIIAHATIAISGQHGPSAGPGRGPDGARVLLEDVRTLASIAIKLLDEVKTKPH